MEEKDNLFDTESYH